MFALSNLLLATGSLLTVTNMVGKTVASNDADVYRSDGLYIYHYPSNTSTYADTNAYPIVSNTGTIFFVRPSGYLDYSDQSAVASHSDLYHWVQVFDNKLYAFARINNQGQNGLFSIDLPTPPAQLFLGDLANTNALVGVVYEEVTLGLKTANNVWVVPTSDKTTIHKLSNAFALVTIIDDNTKIDTDILCLIDSPTYLFATTRTKLIRINKSSNAIDTVAVYGLALAPHTPFVTYDSVSQSVIVSRYQDAKVSIYDVGLNFKYELATNAYPNQSTVKGGVIYVACGAF